MLLRAVESDNPWVFTGLRRLNDKLIFFAVSLSGKEETVALKVQLPNESSTTKEPNPLITNTKLRNAMTGKEVSRQRTETEQSTLRFRLQPFQVVVGRFP